MSEELTLKDNTVENLLFWVSADKRAVMLFATQLDTDLVYLFKVLNKEIKDYEYLKQILTQFVSFTAQAANEMDMRHDDGIKLKHLALGTRLNLELFRNESTLSFPGEPNERNIESIELLMLRLSGAPLKRRSDWMTVEQHKLTRLARAYYFQKRRNLNDLDFQFFNESSKLIQSDMTNYRDIVYRGRLYEAIPIINYADY